MRNKIVEEKGTETSTGAGKVFPKAELDEQEEPIKLEEVSFYGLFLLKIQTLLPAAGTRY